MINKILATLAIIALVAATSQATTIQFTTSEGYTNGDLNGQNSWNANTEWDVANAAGLGNAQTTSNSAGATLGLPAITLTSGQSVTLSANFQFIGSYTAGGQGAANRNFFGLGISRSTTAYGGADTAEATMGLLGNGDAAGTSAYTLLNNYGAMTGMTTINGFNTGDVFQIDYTLTLGANAGASSYTAQITNLTDSLSTALGTKSGLDANVYDALTTTGGFAYFRTSFDMTAVTGVTSAQMNSYTVIPEPSSIALVGLGLAALISRRRRA